MIERINGRVGSHADFEIFLKICFFILQPLKTACSGWTLANKADFVMALQASPKLKPRLYHTNAG
ncbi:hypothetical protein [Novacetimonas cocois]|uniref:hypothetical protein n=1 Tax=Novacetimonas cocois TaxID=1747507 RepID=UPI001057F472|nr:hypothetical protein [Novacetimonas cocois]